MASSDNNRIQCLLEPGQAGRSSTWRDYLQYGFTKTDIPALLGLVADQTFGQMDSESSEVWAPLTGIANLCVAKLAINDKQGINHLRVFPGYALAIGPLSDR